MTTVDRNEIDEQTGPGDALARRALDVASAGLITVPVVTHLYSVALLVRLCLAGFPVSEQGREQRREAWRLDLAILGAAALCVAIVINVWVVQR
jgi:hypothetical protein